MPRPRYPYDHYGNFSRDEEDAAPTVSAAPDTSLANSKRGDMTVVRGVARPITLGPHVTSAATVDDIGASSAELGAVTPNVSGDYPSLVGDLSAITEEAIAQPIPSLVGDLYGTVGPRGHDAARQAARDATARTESWISAAPSESKPASASEGGIARLNVTRPSVPSSFAASELTLDDDKSRSKRGRR